MNLSIKTSKHRNQSLNIFYSTIAILLAVIFFSFSAIPVRAMEYNVDSQNNVKISGACSADVIVRLVSTSDQKKIPYSSGAVCQNGKFTFSDNLPQWNLPAGDYQLVVNNEKTGKTVTIEDNINNKIALPVINAKSQTVADAVPKADSAVSNVSENITTEPSVSDNSQLTIGTSSQTVSDTSDLDQTTTNSLDKNTIQDLITQGAIAVDENSEFQSPSIFKAIADFFDGVIFHSKVQFAGETSFSKDSGGYAIVKKGEDLVRVDFTQEYSEVPIITASLSPQALKNQELQDAIAQYLLISDVKYIVTNVDTKGFEIKMNKPADLDFPFAWNATLINDVQTVNENKTE